jgi:hypothetical protein
MKLRYQFVVQNVRGKPVAVAVGQDNGKFNGMIKLNDSGEQVFKLLSSADLTEEELLSRIAAQYDTAVEAIKPGVLAFIDLFRQSGLLIE